MVKITRDPKYSSNSLQHFGILGMKWGVRRYQNEDGTFTEEGKNHYNKDYSEKQINRDYGVYGNGAVKRINKRMNQGMPISGARSLEASRIAKARSRASTFGKVGGIVTGPLTGFVVAQKVHKLLAKNNDYRNMVLNNPESKMAITLGVTGLTSILGKYGGEALGMISSGYSPSRYRN